MLNGQNSLVTASIVDDALVIPLAAQSLFGSAELAVTGEAYTQNWMTELAGHHEGLSWQVYSLSNGGAFLAPALAGPCRLTSTNNYLSDDFSAEATGIVITLFVLGQMSANAADADGCCDDDAAVLINYHRLIDYAGAHAEAPKIFRAID